MKHPKRESNGFAVFFLPSNKSENTDPHTTKTPDQQKTNKQTLYRQTTCDFIATLQGQYIATALPVAGQTYSSHMKMHAATLSMRFSTFLERSVVSNIRTLCVVYPIHSLTMRHKIHPGLKEFCITIDGISVLPSKTCLSIHGLHCIQAKCLTHLLDSLSHGLKYRI